MKFILLAGMFFAAFFPTNNDGEMEKQAKTEAKKLCSCYKTFEKGKVKLEKGKSVDKYFDFKMKICLEETRTEKATEYIDGLDEVEHSTFKRLVMENMKDCPHVGIKTP